MMTRPSAVFRFLLGVLVLLCLSPAARAGWGEDALQREANYISDCSFTEQAWNHGGVTTSAAAYGAINDVRVASSGPDWVRPGESAMGTIGLMGAAKQLKLARLDTKRYDAVLSRFFQTWVLANRQGWDSDSKDADYGGVARRVFYDTQGHWQRDEAYSTGTTSMMVVAMWKYAEYLTAAGRGGEAVQWRQQAWAIARPAGNYLRRAYDPHYSLIRGNAASRDLWTSDSVFAADALRCLARWAKTAKRAPDFEYTDLADQITQGIEAMKDTGPKKNFFKFRDSRAGYKPTYGQWLDQLCFLPYEADALSPKSAFARRISDWWTIGGDGIRMTAQTDDPKDWRYYGLHWHFYFDTRPENAYLYPGPALQLAKMEWKAGTAQHDPVLLNRAQKRYEWANKAGYSHLWLGDGNQTEAGVGNGLIDWRDGGDYAHKADDWQRFVDTSAYFIQVTLMIVYHTDTQFLPEVTA